MDYVVGSVAALISGNVTPSRPRIMKRALTPTKHQPSPNVTPKSEVVEDRSIFLSPTLQKKKAIVKKSPKRIFQNPDLDSTESNEGNSNFISPKTEKVKKHLKDELECDIMNKNSSGSKKSPKNNHDILSDNITHKKKLKNNEICEDNQLSNENTPKKKKKKVSNDSVTETEMPELEPNIFKEQTIKDTDIDSAKRLKKIKRQQRKSLADSMLNIDVDEKNSTSNITKSIKNGDVKSPNKIDVYQSINSNSGNKPENQQKNKKKNRKPKMNLNRQNGDSNETDILNVTKEEELNDEPENQSCKMKNKKHKKQSNTLNKEDLTETDEIKKTHIEDSMTNKENKHKKKPFINPNAITEQDSDSEHESDDEIESENEEINKKILKADPVDESSSSEEEEVEKKPVKKVEKSRENDEEEVKRTLFVGNVPFNNKCKKEIKKIFNKYGQIDTIRIRTVPVKEAHVTPKLAVIKNELHPERSTVNVYVKFADPDSVEKALIENNTTLNNHHLRVTRSATTGAEHDPRCSVFVGNLPFALEDEAFREKFEKCGEIESVRIIRDKKTNAGKGFGYVNFKSKDSVELALSLPEEDLTIKNRILRVKRSTQSTHKQGPGRNQMNKKGFQGKNQGRFQGQNQGRIQSQNQGRIQGQNQGRNQGQNQGRIQGQSQGRNFGGQNESQGAYRRILNKRKPQDDNEGPPDKRGKNINQPKEKKARKEYVGMTAEKKKKHKINKGQKKNKALSEILTK